MDLHTMLKNKVKGVVELPEEGQKVQDDAKDSFDDVNEELDVEAKIKQARDLGAISNNNTEMNSSTDTNDNEEETSSYDFKVENEIKQTSSYDYELNDEGPICNESIRWCKGATAIKQILFHLITK